MSSSFTVTVAQRRYYVYRNGLFYRSTVATSIANAIFKVAATDPNRAKCVWAAYASGR